MTTTAPLKIAVLGASGHLGRVITEEAVSRGHHVTAVARGVERLRNLGAAAAIGADLRDAQALADTVAGHDAVIAALAGRGPGQARTVPEMARLLLQVLPYVGVDRLVFVGGGGSLEAAPGKRFMDDPHFPEQYKQEAVAAADALDIFRSSASDLKWTFASPPPMYLTGGDRTGVYRAEATDRPILDNSGESRISVADLACAVVDSVEHATFVGQRFTAAY